MCAGKSTPAVCYARGGAIAEGYILNYIDTHVCAHVSQALLETRAARVCVHSMMLDVRQLRMSSGKWLSVVACRLMLAYMSVALVGGGTWTATCVCGSLVAAACWLCVRGLLLLCRKYICIS